jgi:hypothetical protein
MIDAVFAILAVVLMLIALDVFAMRFGADNRDSHNWRIVD